jgi:hypothetical protein
MGEFRKDLLLNDILARHRIAAWLYEVYDQTALAWPQHAGFNYDNSCKGGRVADCTNAFRTVP